MDYHALRYLGRHEDLLDHALSLWMASYSCGVGHFPSVYRVRNYSYTDFSYIIPIWDVPYIHGLKTYRP